MSRLRLAGGDGVVDHRDDLGCAERIVKNRGINTRVEQTSHGMTAEGLAAAAALLKTIEQSLAGISAVHGRRATRASAGAVEHGA
jgi:hypothetical protein